MAGTIRQLPGDSRLGRASGRLRRRHFVEPENGEAGFGSVKFAPIFHYQYKDLFMFESELEVEVDDTGETEVALEYVTVDVAHQ